jgi:branched-chain amino acid transport system ATP-binding protein
MVERLSEALIKVNNSGLAILIVEQDVISAFEIAQRGFVIETGVVRMRGKTQALAQDPAIRQAYLGL